MKVKEQRSWNKDWRNDGRSFKIAAVWLTFVFADDDSKSLKTVMLHYDSNPISKFTPLRKSRIMD